MILADLILGMIEMSLLLYIGLKIYKISIQPQEFITIVLVEVAIIATVRTFTTNVIWQTLLGIAIMIFMLRYFVKKSWFISLITVFTSYLIGFMQEGIIFSLIKNSGIYFKELNQTRGIDFYLFGLQLQIPDLILATLLKYTNLHITDLRKFD